MSLSEESLQGHCTKVAESRKCGLWQWQKCDVSSQWRLGVKRYVFNERLKTASEVVVATVVVVVVVMMMMMMMMTSSCVCVCSGCCVGQFSGVRVSGARLRPWHDIRRLWPRQRRASRSRRDVSVVERPWPSKVTPRSAQVGEWRGLGAVQHWHSELQVSVFVYVIQCCLMLYNDDAFWMSSYFDERL